MLLVVTQERVISGQKMCLIIVFKFNVHIDSDYLTLDHKSMSFDVSISKIFMVPIYWILRD